MGAVGHLLCKRPTMRPLTMVASWGYYIRLSRRGLEAPTGSIVPIIIASQSELREAAAQGCLRAPHWQ